MDGTRQMPLATGDSDSLSKAVKHFQTDDTAQSMLRRIKQNSNGASVVKPAPLAATASVSNL